MNKVVMARERSSFRPKNPPQGERGTAVQSEQAFPKVNRPLFRPSGTFSS